MGADTATALRRLKISRAQLFALAKEADVRPMIVPMSQGRGKRAAWSEGHLQFFEHLIALKQRRVPVSAALARLRTEDYRHSPISEREAEDVADLWMKPGSGGALAERLELPDGASLTDCFVAYVSAMAVAIAGREANIPDAARHLLPQAIYTYLGGSDPVLVFVGGPVKIVPRVALPHIHRGLGFDVVSATRVARARATAHQQQAHIAHVLADQGPADRLWEHAPAFLSIELSSLLDALWRTWGRPLPSVRVLSPANVVCEHTDDGTVIEYDADINPLSWRGVGATTGWSLDTDPWSARVKSSPGRDPSSQAGTNRKKAKRPDGSKAQGVTEVPNDEKHRKRIAERTRTQ